MKTRRFVRWFAVLLSAAATAPAWPRAPAAPCPCQEPGAPPPQVPLLVCTASQPKGGITSVAGDTVSVTCKWQFTFTCSPAPMNGCAVCWAVEWDYWDASVSAWFPPAPPGVNTGTSTDACGKTHLTSGTSVYTYPPPLPPPSRNVFAPGVLMRVTVSAGVWTSSMGPGCTGTPLTVIWRKQFYRADLPFIPNN